MVCEKERESNDDWLELLEVAVRVRRHGSRDVCLSVHRAKILLGHIFNTIVRPETPSPIEHAH